MSLFLMVSMAVAVSIDGSLGGFAFGLHKVKTSYFNLFIIAVISVIGTSVAMLFGLLLRAFIPMHVANLMGGLLIIALGLFVLRTGLKSKSEKSVDESVDNLVDEVTSHTAEKMGHEEDLVRNMSLSESITFGIAVAIDASMCAFTIALQGAPFFMPLLFGVAHFSMAGIGNVIALYTERKFLGNKLPLLPGFLLIAIGVLRIL